MNRAIEPQEHYKLLTPGPLTTTSTVKEAMLKDWCTWDDDYKNIVQAIRKQLLTIGEASEDKYTAVLMQGSGTFGVEAAIGTVIPAAGKLLVLANGAYGTRIGEIARVLGISHEIIEAPADQPLKPAALEAALDGGDFTHVAFVHCETTTGILNPLEELAAVAKNRGKTLIVDAMSSFGGIPIAVESLGIDFLISSANKCIQGVPGFCFVLAKKAELALCAGQARSLSLDLFEQDRVMNDDPGKWRFTSPTHVVRAFGQALTELKREGGVGKRHQRYVLNQRTLVRRMTAAGFTPYLPEALQSPIITTFRYPDDPAFTFESLYRYLKTRGFVIYPGKLSEALVFRIGSIGDVNEDDMERLGDAATDYAAQLQQ